MSFGVKVRTQSACHQSLESYLLEFQLDTISLLEGKPVWSYRWRIQISLWKQMWGALIASWSTVEILACRMSEFFMLSSDLQQQTSFFLLWIWYSCRLCGCGLRCGNMFWFGVQNGHRGKGKRERKVKQKQKRASHDIPMVNALDNSPLYVLLLMLLCQLCRWRSELYSGYAYYFTAQLLTWRCQDLVDYSDLNEMHGVKRRQSEGDVML